MSTRVTRRGVVLGAAGLGAGLLLPGCARLRPGPGAGGEEEVSPGEDLMREHGVLRRLLLVYEEAARRLDGRKRMPVDTIAAAAGLVRRFVEDYHERIEEEHVFPRLERAGQLTALVAVLKRQHDAGRKLTTDVLKLTVPARVASAAGRKRLGDTMHAFVRMYRPHAAREDTVLFPALHRMVDEREYRDLGETFERRERELVGEHGFDAAVAEVAKLEKALGLDDLAKSTPA